MGQTNSVNVILKVAQSIATKGIKKENANLTANHFINFNAKSDWDYFIQYSNSSSILSLAKKPEPKNIDPTLNVGIISDVSNIDNDHLKLVAKIAVASAVYDIQSDKAFTKWLQKANGKVAKSEEQFSDNLPTLTPVYIVNSINSILDTHLNASLLWTCAGRFCEYKDISTRAIFIENGDYPQDLVSFAKKSVQHAYIANIAGALINMLNEFGPTKYIGSELSNQANKTKKREFYTLSIIFILLLAVLAVGFFNIGTVIMNESHHASKHETHTTLKKSYEQKNWM